MQRNTPPPSLTTTWRYRLRELRSSLEHDPASALAARRRMHAKVLTFLLSRYGHDPRSRFVPRRAPRMAPAAPNVMAVADVRPIHTQARIRRTLDKIVAVRHGTPPWQIVLVKGAERNRSYITVRQLW